MYFQRICFFLIWTVWGISQAMAQPNANFTANNTSGCSNQSTVVNFQDLSTGNPVSWLWNFGAGASTSNLQNPTFVYSNPGCYNVTLTVTDALGQSNTIVQNCFVEVFQAPIPEYIVDNTSGCAPFTACFTDNSTASSPIVNYQWTFTDGSSANGANPCFTFTTAPDTVGLVLSVTDANGCFGIAQFPDIIQVVEAPVLGFAVDVNSACSPPLTVNVTNQTQLNGATNPVYTWIFPGGSLPGGGSQVTGPNPPPVTYGSTGQFDITLIVASATGCEDTLTLPSVVGVGGVVADFTASATNVCVGQEILFTNASTGGVTTYEWNFGETLGINSTDLNPSHTYTTPGTYTVTLRANNAACGDTIERANYIVVDPLPTAVFTPDRLQDCQPGLPFTFTNQSTGASAFAWDFGDGATSTLQDPQHTFAAFGNYTVCLVAINPDGCSDTSCVIINVQAPNVNFTRDPTEGCVPVDVQFTGISTSADPVVTWDWDFGGGGTPPTSNVQNPTSLFTTPGTYTVSLTITTQGGCTATRTIAGAVRAGTPPQVDFTWSDDTVCLSEPVTFISTFTDNNWDYYWDFQYEAPGNFAQMMDTAITMYPDTGLFSVGLIIDNEGCRDTLILEDLIYASPPKANFVLDSYQLCGLPGTITITDSSIGPADTYGWFLNGNLISTQQNPPPLNITSLGNYLLTQALLNSSTGCSDTFTTAFVAGDPQADFTVSTNLACRGEPVTFSRAPSFNAISHRWYYDFVNAPNQFTISNGDNQHAYSDTGSYTVRLVTIDQFGCRDTITKNLHIDVVGPYANFAPDVTGGCNPLTVTFFDSTATSSLSNLISWNWDLGNGATSNLQNPSNTYTQSGTYDVTLIATDDEGCVDTLTIPNLIQVTFPEPAFSVVDSSTCAGAPVEFQNLSVGFGMQYLWKFGDGTTSTDVTPVHAYPRDLALPYDSTDVYYQVTLIVTDINGCVDSIVVDSAIYIEPFQAAFSGDPTVGICPPLNTQYSDSTIGAVTAWRWDFGDGFGQSQLQNPAHVYFFPGIYDVTLVATHEDGCRDTAVIEDYVQLAGPNGSFFLDRDSICLGDTVTLTLITTGASLVNPVAWQDGSVDVVGGLSGINDTIVVEHIYNSVGLFAPVVVVQDVQGCQVTLPDSPMVEVFAPPVAMIAPRDIIGCTPFSIAYQDSSTSSSGSPIQTWNWDFGDGNAATDPNPVHTFLDSGLFVVRLVIEDGLGCVGRDSTTATSLEGVIANFSTSDSIGCAPFEVSFTDLSFNGVPTSWQWDFGDGNTSDASNPTHTYLQNGRYTVTLIVNDGQGCADTLVKPDHIFLRSPQVSIEASTNAGCNPIDITFFARDLISDTTIVEYLWCLTEVNVNQTVCTPTGTGRDSLRIPFTEPGNYIMTVTVTDIFGCAATSDTVQVDITSRGTPDPVVIRRATVLNDESIQVDWLRYDATDFVEYVVYRLNGPGAGAIATITNQNVTSFTEVNPALDPRNSDYCYEILVLNSCDELSDPVLTMEHCTINLETTPEIDAIRLDWNAYVGFPVGQYEIYRTDVYDTTQVVLIATVPGGTLSFLDTDMFCRDSVSYRVLAIGFGNTFQRSYSDLSADAPIHLEPTEPVDVILATVVDNETVNIFWTEYLGYLPDYYLIERSSNGIDWDSVGVAQLGDLSFVDTTARVEEESYFYRVFAVDECGDLTVAGFIGRTILLQSRIDPTGKIPLLNWTQYEEWANGVLNYEIQIFNENTGEWEPVDVTNGNLTSYNDTRTVFDQANYCYRIVAYEVGGNGSQSVSNESCVIFGPAIYAPNAFTPNNDGENDSFRIFVPNAREATLSIYSRWGELIFQTSDLRLSWPGTRGAGDIVPEGVYVYVVSGVGFDGTRFSRSGTVTLIK